MVMKEQEMAATGEKAIAIDTFSTLLQLPDGQHQPNKDLNLGRQASIYSLTLDEFQHTLSGSGKNFGSMNMDEFLASIWTAEENQNQINDTSGVGNPENVSPFDVGGPGDPKGVCRQSSLPRQGSLSLPAQLCTKTVDEVWSEIRKGQGIGVRGRGGNVQNPVSANRREMTLEDFLIKAGVVWDQQCAFPTMPAQQQQQQLIGFYQGGNGSANSGAGAGFTSRPIAGIVAGGAQVGVYGGRVGNGGGGGFMATGAIVGPLSPVSNSEGMVVGVGGVDGVGNQYGMDMARLRGRKRIFDGPVEKGVERRQRRMIKNRESAARSRARKQAYTVELEAELKQLKEESKQLKQALAELENKRKQQCFEETRTKAQTRAQRDKERLRMMRRNMSCPL